VRHLVEAHHGRVEVQSPGAGAGTTFRVVLPLVPPADASGTAAARTPTLVRMDGTRVLHLDDEPESREVIGESLRLAGAEVLEADELRAALALCAPPPAIVIHDVDGATNGDGTGAFIGAVRAAGVVAPIVALTARVHGADRQRLLEAGYAMALARPIDPSDLCTVVAHLAHPGGAE
jgi:two-component system CheB/CheR fusion protein